MVAGTKIADVIVPEIFNPYVVQRTPVLSALWLSGIIGAVPEITAAFNNAAGGTRVAMPFWNDLTGAEEILSDTVPLTPDKITTGQDEAVVHFRGKAWAANGLVAALTGDDPVRVIGDLVANFWIRRMQAALIAQLAGVFAAASMSSLVSDISGAGGAAAIIGAQSIVDAQYKLGDQAENLTAFAMHSAVVALLDKQQLIATVVPSQGDIPFRTYLGKRIIVDDGMPVASGVYTSYLFGAGAVGFAEANLPINLPATETARDYLQGDDILINRRAFVLHVRGIRWIGTPAGVSPTNVELAVGTNYSRVYDPKLIRVVQFKHRIA
jgi:hypothetical protein